MNKIRVSTVEVMTEKNMAVELGVERMLSMIPNTLMYS
jgi:hypothetical protein